MNLNECPNLIIDDIGGCFDHPNYIKICTKDIKVVSSNTCQNCAEFRKLNIKARLQEHYDAALTLFPEKQIVGLWLQGSQNYNLDTKTSDIDTKLIVVPTLDDMIFLREPRSHTYILPNGEHLDYKDIRLYTNTLRKQNLNFVEILFTDYFIINPFYEDLWNKWVAARELIGRYCEMATIKSMRGQILNKMHTYKLPSNDNRITAIEKYGYDPKELSHALRFEYFVNKFLDGEAYIDCMRPDEETAQYLRSVKNGRYSLQEAEYIVETQIKDIVKVCDDYIDSNETIKSSYVDQLLNSVQKDIVERAIL